MLLHELDGMIKLVCPIHGISGKDNNNNKIHFKDDATDEQKQAALEIYDANINLVE